MSALLRHYLPAGLAALALAVAAIYADVMLRERHLNDRRIQALNHLSAIRARIESNILINVQTVQGLVAMIQSEPQMDQQRFAALAEHLFGSRTQLRNIGAAPDLVVTLVYPVAGNEASIGLNYRHVPEQAEAVERARNSRQPILAGPVDLVQGGEGLIGRFPVYTSHGGEERFWGLVSAVIDLDHFYLASGLDRRRGGLIDPEDRLRLAIRGRDGRGAEGEHFFGSEELYDLNPITAEVTLPIGSWQLAAVPEAGWGSGPPLLLLWRAAFAALWLVVVVPLLWVGYSQLKRSEAEESLRLYASLFRHSGEAILVTDSDNRIVDLNPAFTRLTGYSLEELNGENPRILSSGKTPRETYQLMWAALEQSGYWQGELWDRRRDGMIYPKWATLSRILDEEGNTSHFMAGFTDISERKAAEERIEQLAHHDSLTGLYNRYSLEGRLSQSLLAAQRSGHSVAVIFIDMDRFKIINDTLGHHTGDLLLIEVARRLLESVRESDIVARQGGDEFVVVLSALESTSVALPVVSRIHHSLGSPYHIGENLLHSTPSVGIALFPGDGKTSEELMKNADTAMYHAKEQGRNNVQFFTHEMNEVALERSALESDLRQLLCRPSGSIGEQLTLYYQPQIRSADHIVEAVEALIRWNHPHRGFLVPDSFIPIAEESGLIEPLGEWVLAEGCRQLALWHAAGHINMRLAVNISPRQLRSADLVAAVRRSLDENGLDGSMLELEVTESLAMDNPHEALTRLEALRELGVALAIDDFGTGYSSLAYLKFLPIETLKIDRSFVRDIESDLNDAAICIATLAMAHGLGLRVVAEGVETAEQEAFLTAQRCDLLQGYYYSRPLPADELAAIFARFA